MEILRLIDEIMDLRGDYIAISKDQMRNLRNRIEGLYKERDQIRGQTLYLPKTLQGRTVEEWKKEADIMKEQLEAANKRVHTYYQDNGERVKKIDELEKENAYLLRRQVELDLTVSREEKEIEGLNADKEDLRGQIEQLRNAIASKNNQLLFLEKSLDAETKRADTNYRWSGKKEADTSIRLMTANIEAMQRAYNKLEQEKVAVEKELRRINTSIKDIADNLWKF